MATTILMARHGETDWNRESRFQGHADTTLNDAGRSQARELAERLAGDHIVAVYASPLLRALETAEIVAARLGLEVETVDGLREVDVGSWSGLTRTEVEQRHPDGFRRWLALDHGWEDGESYEELGRRVLASLRKLAERHPASGCSSSVTAVRCGRRWRQRPRSPMRMRAESERTSGTATSPSSASKTSGCADSTTSSRAAAAATMRGRELADLDSARRACHVARAPGFGPPAGAGRRRALHASRRRRPLDGAVPEAVAPAHVARRARAREPGARKRYPEAPTVRHSYDTRSGAASAGSPDTGRTSGLHASGGRASRGT